MLISLTDLFSYVKLLFSLNYIGQDYFLYFRKLYYPRKLQNLIEENIVYVILVTSREERETKDF